MDSSGIEVGVVGIGGEVRVVGSFIACAKIAHYTV
jgi:hypothetical protein